MGANAASESLRHDENLSDLFLEQKNGTIPASFPLYILSSFCVLAVSKLAAMTARAAQKKGLRCCSCGRILLAT